VHHSAISRQRLQVVGRGAELYRTSCSRPEGVRRQRTSRPPKPRARQAVTRTPLHLFWSGVLFFGHRFLILTTACDYAGYRVYVVGFRVRGAQAECPENARALSSAALLRGVFRYRLERAAVRTANLRAAVVEHVAIPRRSAPPCGTSSFPRSSVLNGLGSHGARTVALVV